jgi:hypothetical protein
VAIVLVDTVEIIVVVVTAAVSTANHSADLTEAVSFPSPFLFFFLLTINFDLISALLG